MARDDRPILVTIATSHYCEKARWALERRGIDFREEAHVPLVSRLAGLRRGVWYSVPILVTSGGVVRDSTAILRWADERGAGRRLYPDEGALRAEVEDLEERFDAALGPHTRRLAYAWLLPERRLALEAALAGVPLVERGVTRAFYPVVRKVMERGLRITPAGVERSRRAIDEVFAEVAARIGDGRRYLAGDRLTAADITLASLAAPVLLPPEYGSKLPAPDELPEGPRAEVERLRASAAGRLVLRLYAEERVGRA